MLPALVRSHAQTHPNHVAVVVGQECLTYAELDDQASRLTHQLRCRGIGRGSLVGIHLDRTPDAVVALLAVLGSGAAYTVVEPTEPVMEGVGRLGSAEPGLVLTSRRYRDTLADLGLDAMDVREADSATIGRAEPVEPMEDDIAYVLYTSGSTGVPKGVVVTHDNIRHYTTALLARLGITEPLRYAHVTTLAADLGNTCLFLPLWTGGTLHLVDDATRRDPAGLLRRLQTERIDVLKTTPSHWNALFRAFGQDAATRPELRFLLLGGEAMAPSLARRILDSGVTRTLVNHYGPTETTVGITAHVLHGPADLDAYGDAGSVPIGTAFGATRLFIRTDDGRFHERDATGELYVTGPSVSRGYRGDTAAGATAFTNEIERRFPGAGRAYRTGDKVRADAQGVLEFLGRGDRQVKIGGYRVELGHVEAGLHRLPEVTDAVALHLVKDRPILVAAVRTTGDPAGAQPDVLRTRLRELLPPYMVPDRIEVFDDFPRNDNGKTDQRALRGLIETQLGSRADRAHAVDDPVLAEVCAVWRRHLGHGDFAVDDDFTSVGGGSIDAIQIIADLQAKGHQVSAAAFLAEPTATALAARIRAGATDAAAVPAGRNKPPVPADDTALSPAQRWFFRQDFAQPDQWNQALLLDVDSAVRPEELAAAVGDLTALHPMLHTAFLGVGSNRRRETVQPHRAFGYSRLPDGDQPAAQHIRDIASGLQTEMSLTDGSLFKAHLFQGATQAHLLLVCHHLSVDAVSWRIVVSDLSRCYTERLRGNVPTTSATTSFGSWATHLRDYAPSLQADLGHWADLSRFSVLPDGPSSSDDNQERDARAVWFQLSRTQTDALARAGVATTGTPPHAALLGAFALALGEADGACELVVDVESHGRAVFDETLEVSRAVGWFTSTYPVRLDIVEGDVAATGKSVTAALDETPNLGIAYGLHAQPRRADVCFNYLGSFTLPHGDDLRPALSRHTLGPVRGPENDRGYGLKLTARIRDGQLVADLSYTPHRHDPDRMLKVARATRDHLLTAAGLTADEGQFVVEHGSSTGLLAQVPRALSCEPPTATRDYDAVLLTGATGFIGAHLLHFLLTRTKGHVHCLVRERPGRPARQRLRAAYAWYQPDDDLDHYADRLTVHAADLSEPGFGLDGDAYGTLARDIEAIYHLASDTRLFGDRASFDRHNTEPVRALIGLATTGRPKDLHYVSTLAVCGTGSEGQPTAFSEDSLHIGQRFLNEYERSKYDAECLVHDFVAAGGTGFVYRSGNVTGHSRSGRFQRNGSDNRLVQLLRACVHLGRVPHIGSQTLALSPVDTVAQGILQISRSARVPGGTFHVDTPHEVSYEDIFAVLRELGCAVEDDPAPTFAALFGRFIGGGDEQISLAHFWASRPHRNVRYDHRRTQRLLTDLGVEFGPLDRDWLRAYFTGLIQQGEIVLAHDK
ncbi:non-ribosomal peptide synthetase [Streptomyces noursei]|uniref:Non-ribosomal peptide synthetase n=1 Tax=Streptomyces noursei TaxID=1971 RepID=A0A2N8PGH0_STRNR|nr:non-ribosomal peptide synthetase [Streptomyces noursei]PNE40117.1 non-ribosomal peptide synthetase [Streptomyces noursei]